MPGHPGDGLPAELRAWADRRGALEGWTVDALAGGAVSARVERITFRISGSDVLVVRKSAFGHEVAGLRAA
jgi:hypothetical protein